MSAAKCQCMPPESGTVPSLGMASRQFAKPACPCNKCKDRAREQQLGRSQAIANSAGPLDKPCSCAGATGQQQRQGPEMGMGPGMGSGMGMGPGPSRQQPMYSQPISGSRPNMCQCTSGGMRQGMGQGMGPGMRQGMGMGPGPGPSRQQPNYGQPASGSRPDMCQCTGAQMARGMGPGMGQGMGPGMGQGMSPGIIRSNQGYGSPATGGVVFGAMILNERKSSADGTFLDDPRNITVRTGCLGSLEYDAFADESWAPQGLPFGGRDTFGLPIHLQGNKGLLNAGGGGTCSHMVQCDHDCGVDTGCHKDCHRMHNGPGAMGGKGGMAGRDGLPNNRTSQGIRICSNEYINMIVTFLMEVLGILVFFAICTLTFWITVGYYIVQLLIDLKNADRNVQMAVGIALGLLVMAFAITLVTHSSGTCYGRATAISKGIASSGSKTSSSCNKCNQAAIASAKRVCASKCKVSSIPKPKPKPKPKAKAHSVSLLAKSKCPKTGCSKPKSSAIKSRSQPRRRYTDCQGRAIFDSSRRCAILTEMKQPPTWILWIRDSLNSYFGSR